MSEQIAMDFEIFQDLPPTPPIITNYEPNGCVPACQKEENSSIEHDTEIQLLISEEEVYRIQARVQWLGIRNALQKFMESYVFGRFQEAQYFHNMATSAYIMYSPRCKAILAFQESWGTWIKACCLMAKYVKKNQGTPETRSLKWKCHRCKKLVTATDSSCGVTRWECKECFTRAPIVPHLLLVCRGNKVYKEFISKMVKVEILRVSPSSEVCEF